MPRGSDLVCDSKLETYFHSDSTISHVFHESDLAFQRRSAVRVEHWIRVKNIGRGSHGDIWLEKRISKHHDGSEAPGPDVFRAVKQIPKFGWQSETIDYNCELEAMAKFSHTRYVRCFVQFHGWYEKDSMLFISMEYFPYGDLAHHIHVNDCLPELEAQEIVYQVAEGLNYLHENEFTHRDVKSSNILIRSKPSPDSGSWWVKIADFGISKRAKEGTSRVSTIKGTWQYMPPELHGLFDEGINHSSKNPQSIDIWALGETSFFLLTKEHCFENIGYLAKYVEGRLPFPSHPLRVRGITREGIDFVKKTMKVPPKDRLSVKQSLTHSWLKSFKASSFKPASITLTGSPYPSNIADQIQSLTMSQPSAIWSEESRSSSKSLEISQNATRVLTELSRPESHSNNLVELVSDIDNFLESVKLPILSENTSTISETTSRLLSPPDLPHFMLLEALLHPGTPGAASFPMSSKVSSPSISSALSELELEDTSAKMNSHSVLPTSTHCVPSFTFTQIEEFSNMLFSFPAVKPSLIPEKTPNTEISSISKRNPQVSQASNLLRNIPPKERPSHTLRKLNNMQTKSLYRELLLEYFIERYNLRASTSSVFDITSGSAPNILTETPSYVSTKTTSGLATREALSRRYNAIFSIKVPEDIYICVAGKENEFSHSRFTLFTSSLSEFSSGESYLRPLTFAPPRHIQFLIVVKGSWHPDYEDTLDRILADVRSDVISRQGFHSRLEMLSWQSVLLCICCRTPEHMGDETLHQKLNLTALGLMEPEKVIFENEEKKQASLTSSTSLLSKFSDRKSFPRMIEYTSLKARNHVSNSEALQVPIQLMSFDAMDSKYSEDKWVQAVSEHLDAVVTYEITNKPGVNFTSASQALGILREGVKHNRLNDEELRCTIWNDGKLHSLSSKHRLRSRTGTIVKRLIGT